LNGLVCRQQGKGTFVTKHIKENRWLRLEISMSSLLETISQNVPHFLTIDRLAEAHCIVTDDQNVAIYVADIIYRGDCIKFDMELLQTLNAENNAG